MAARRVFVTVGTTKFDKLLQTVLEPDILNALKALGYTELQLQTGTGNVELITFEGIKMHCDRYIEDFDEQLEIADLIISHAGAGTCLEILKKKKPAIIVINEDLMDNHQIELAEQLQKDGYIYFCTCNGLKECLSNDINLLTKYPESDKDAFSTYLDKCMGFT